MKKIIYTIVFLTTLIGGKLLANHQQQILHINLPNCQPSTIFIDGVNYGTIQSQFELPNIPAGKHFVRITKMEKVQYNNGYKHRNHNGNKKYFMTTLFDGIVFAKPNHVVNLSLDPYNHFRIDYEKLFVNNAPACAPHHDYDNDDHYNHNNGPVPVNEYEFGMFLNTVKNSWFDNSKKDLIFNFAQNNYITAQQAATLIRECDFENTKLMVAKRLFDQTIDKNNYYCVFQYFDFENSKLEMSNYMNRK